jgi:outer membrane immunogenic protein
VRRVFKHILAAGAVALATGGQSLAADLYTRPQQPPPYPSPLPLASVPPWAGFYFGGNLGVGWSQGSLSDTAGNTFTPNNSANFLGGGQIGYNWQFGSVVAGIEADFDWAGNQNNISNAAAGVTVTTNDRWLTTLTGRLGYAWNTQWLVYGKGGGAWVGSSDPTITNVTTGAAITPSTTNSNFGWTLGVGVEWAFLPDWSARLEYDYIGLNSQTFTIPAPGLGGLPAGDQFTSQNRNFQMVNVGVNYKFHLNGF